ncbi:hypothetical protein [Spirosoma koreense]
MKNNLVLYLSLIFLNGSCDKVKKFASDTINTTSSSPGKWIVVRSSTRGECRVQDNTTRPIIGNNLLGRTFNTESEAKDAMCAAYQEGSEGDSDKCASVYPSNACQ